MATTILNALGLAADFFGAAMLIRFPYRLLVRDFTPEGGEYIRWIGAPTEEGRKAARRFDRLSRAGPILLLIGFALQFVAVLLK